MWQVHTAKPIAKLAFTYAHMYICMYYKAKWWCVLVCVFMVHAICCWRHMWRRIYRVGRYYYYVCVMWRRRQRMRSLAKMNPHWLAAPRLLHSCIVVQTTLEYTCTYNDLNIPPHRHASCIMQLLCEVAATSTLLSSFAAHNWSFTRALYIYI